MEMMKKRNIINVYMLQMLLHPPDIVVGVANSLMDTLEKYAYNDDNNDNNNTKTITLFLHVKVDNDAAQTFYSNSRRGYCIPTSNQIQNINITQLEENSGVSGGGQEPQILLCKVLTKSVGSYINGSSSSKPVITMPLSTAAAIGFSSSSSSSSSSGRNTNNKSSQQQKKKKKLKVKRKKK